MGKIGDEVGRHGDHVGAAQPELKYSEAALAVALLPSRLGVVLLGAMAVATLALIAATPGLTALRILAATWVSCAALEAIHTVALRRGRRGVCAIRLQRSGEIAVCMASGAWRQGVARDGSFVAPWLTIVRWRPEGARWDRTILVLPDMLGADAFRALRVLLRWS
jgi:hypothetical protein